MAGRHWAHVAEAFNAGDMTQTASLLGVLSEYKERNADRISPATYSRIAAGIRFTEELLEKHRSRKRTRAPSERASEGGDRGRKKGDTRESSSQGSRRPKNPRGRGSSHPRAGERSAPSGRQQRRFVGDLKGYYKVLGVRPTARRREIKAAYRRVALALHPDKNMDDKEAAMEKFHQLREAYEVLSDKERRAEYDEGVEDFKDMQKEDVKTRRGRCVKVGSMKMCL